jgi:4-amino-4-deoxy-L-arabinose transferase-like glycosyltransferase
MEFLGDQGRDVVIIRDFLKNGNLFFIGPQTSIGNMYLGPWFYYFIAPSLLFANFSPVGPAVFIALLSVATVYLIYRFALTLFKNPFSAYLAAFFYAISPVVIKYSNFIWNPNVMPFFSLLLVYSLYHAFFNKRFNYLILASASFIMTLNSHYLAFALIPIIALCYFIFIVNNRNNKKTLKKLVKPTIIAIIIFILSLTPQVLFDIKHNGQNVNALVTFFTQRETTVSIKPYKALPLAFPLFDQINTRLIFGKNTQVAPYASIAFALLLLFTFFRLLAPTINQKRTIKITRSFIGYLLLLSWYAIAIIGLGLYKQHVYDHYFAFVFPAVFILLSLTI